MKCTVTNICRKSTMVLDINVKINFLFKEQFLSSSAVTTKIWRKKNIFFFPFISLSVMVFSTIKFYGVPAGHRVHGDSPEKEVSTRCCMRTLSCYYHQTVMAFCPILPFLHPPPTPQDNRMAPQQLHVLQLCPFAAYFIVFVEFFFFPP